MAVSGIFFYHSQLWPTFSGLLFNMLCVTCCGSIARIVLYCLARGHRFYSWPWQPHFDESEMQGALMDLALGVH